MTDLAEPRRAPTPDHQQKLYRTDTGSRLHLRRCPHLVDRPSIKEATREEIDSLAVCDLCERELNGRGRSYHATLDDAMRVFGSPVGLRARVRQELKGVVHDQIWLPYSRSYIALGHHGRAVAWAGKHWIAAADGLWVTLPGFVAHGGSHTAKGDLYGELCPRCYLSRSVTGACDSCD